MELTFSLTILEEEIAFPQKGSFSRNEHLCMRVTRNSYNFTYSIAPKRDIKLLHTAWSLEILWKAWLQLEALSSSEPGPHLDYSSVTPY